MNGIVLAAGKGTRMRPLSRRVPKPLLPVAGRPLLGRILGALAAAGLERIVVNTHHLAGDVEAFVEGSPEKGRVVLSHEPEILGSGGALVKARAVLSAGGSFIYHNADELTDLDGARALEAHRAAGSPLATLVLREDAAENRVLVAKNGEVLDIAGKRGAAAPEGSRLLAFIGVAVVSGAVFDHLPKEERFCSVMDALVDGMSKNPGCVRAFVPDDIYWRNIEDVGRYLEVHREILSGGAMRFPGEAGGPVQVCAGADVSAGAQLSGFVSVCPGARVEAGASLRDCVVLGGARVGRGVRHSKAVVGDGFAYGAAA